jgi:DNA-binding NtrC family response regulator
VLPFDIQLDLHALADERDRRVRQQSEERPRPGVAFDGIVHRGAAMSALLSRAERVARRQVPVLLQGPSGSGKELLARAIHAASDRAGGPFVAVNCGAIPAELLESELFGHERGAFTGADQARLGRFREASDGTLFLDEIGELPLTAQVKLLRVLQEGEVVPVGGRAETVRTRIVAATHHDLLGLVDDGGFREDLFYRIAVAVLRLPPLAARPQDLDPLVDAFLAELSDEAHELGEAAPVLTDGARQALRGHDWPGNVRELRHTLRRACLWADGVVDGDDVERALLRRRRPETAILGRPLGAGLSLPEVLHGVAVHYLERGMRASGGNKSEAARLLGLPSYQTLGNWLKKYGVEPS